MENALIVTPSHLYPKSKNKNKLEDTTLGAEATESVNTSSLVVSESNKKMKIGNTFNSSPVVNGGKAKNHIYFHDEEEINESMNGDDTSNVVHIKSAITEKFKITEEAIGMETTVSVGNPEEQLRCGNC